MKKWIGILVTLVLLVCVSYFVMGFVVESTLNKNVAGMIVKNPILSVDLENYQRGWMSSEAALAIKFTVPASVNASATTPVLEQFDFTVPLTIEHGPFIFGDSGVRFGMGYVTTTPQTHYSALVNYFDHTVFKCRYPSFSMDAKLRNVADSLHFEWLGIDSVFNVSPNIDEAKASLVLNGLTISGKDFSLKLGRVFSDIKSSLAPEGVWVGDSNSGVDSISVKAADKVFDLEQLDWLFHSNITDGLLSYSSEMSLQKLLVDNKTYGPGILKWTVKNLDPVVLVNVRNQAWDMSMNNQGANPLEMLTLFGNLPKLFAKGAAIEVSELDMVVPEGKITGSFTVSLPKNEITSPEQIMEKAHAEGQLKAPVAVVKQLMVMSIERNMNKQAQSAPAAQVTQTTPTATTETTAAAPGTTSTAPGTTPATPMPPASTPVVIDYHAEAKKQADTIFQDFVSKGFIKLDGADCSVTFQLDDKKLTVNGHLINP